MTGRLPAASSAGVAGTAATERRPTPAGIVTLIDGRPEAQLGVFDRGLHFGDGLFETIACLGGTPRLLSLHCER
ncbi:MAG TPA: hypothetical protein VLX90_14535, partial [Steroidobacteraceae bacterium]|nr:hypothetical protein [Steroidobacteraceae bacterium]